jgi:hypothetical protein
MKYREKNFQTEFTDEGFLEKFQVIVVGPINFLFPPESYVVILHAVKLHKLPIYTKM